MALIRTLLEAVAGFTTAAAALITFYPKFATWYYTFLPDFGIDKLIIVTLVAITAHILLGD